MTIRILFLTLILSVSAFSQMPPIELGVSQELAKWRAARYSDVRYKLHLTLEKMSPVLKGTIEIRVKVGGAGSSVPPAVAGGEVPIVLDWRKTRGHEEKSTISNVTLNGKVVQSASFSSYSASGETSLGSGERDKSRTLNYSEHNEHLIFTDGVVIGENVIQLDFTSPILASGSAITRYVDKEDGSEYLYSLFVPSDASTAFPVFDQPDIKAKFTLTVASDEMKVISNSPIRTVALVDQTDFEKTPPRRHFAYWHFEPTQPISTYVFAFAAGPFEKFNPDSLEAGLPANGSHIDGRASPPLNGADGSIYVRKSQASKFKPHAAEVFRLNREAVRYFEEYFDYKFPFPKYDLVLIPEFPFGGMEHAGATFLREASIIFPQEPTKNDHISRATLIFHEAAHQWFGDTVTMRWFDDLWLKEGFATFTAYKAMERIMPEMNAWKVFYERVKQAAYQTDSTKGTTAIYQPIANLSAAKSAYGNIVYNKAPAFLRQAEFYLGEDKFQTAVRAFLKKHEFKNATWEDLVKEFEIAGWKVYLKDFSSKWVTQTGLPMIKVEYAGDASEWTDRGHTSRSLLSATFKSLPKNEVFWLMNTNALVRYREQMPDGTIKEGSRTDLLELGPSVSYNDPKPKLQNEFTELLSVKTQASRGSTVDFVFPNYQDYGYGIFLLDEKSRDYVLKSIQNEKDPFLRAMMWGALWDSVREGELDPREYVELVVRVLSKSAAFTRSPAETPKGVTLTEDESTTALLLSRVGTAMNYYIDAPGGLASRVEEMLISGMHNSPTQGQRITYYRAFLNIASSEKARGALKGMIRNAGTSAGESAAKDAGKGAGVPLRTKDKFDIVTRLLILNDPDAPKLLSELEKTETSDDAKRYAYAAKAGIGTAENKAKYWNDFVNNKEISESWIEAAFGPWNSIRHSELTLPYLQKALQELPNHKRSRKIFFVNGWLGAFIGGQRSETALAVVNKFLSENPGLDNDLRLKILENVDVIERAVRIRGKY